MGEDELAHGGHRLTKDQLSQLPMCLPMHAYKKKCVFGAHDGNDIMGLAIANAGQKDDFLDSKVLGNAIDDVCSGDSWLLCMRHVLNAPC